MTTIFVSGDVLCEWHFHTLLNGERQRTPTGRRGVVEEWSAESPCLPTLLPIYRPPIGTLVVRLFKKQARHRNVLSRKFTALSSAWDLCPLTDLLILHSATQKHVENT